MVYHEQPPESSLRPSATEPIISLRNCLLASTVLGACIGLGIGIAAWRGDPRVPEAFGSGVEGCLIGAAVGLAIGYWLVFGAWYAAYGARLILKVTGAAASMGMTLLVVYALNGFDAFLKYGLWALVIFWAALMGTIAAEVGNRAFASVTHNNKLGGSKPERDDAEQNTARGTQ